jgi:hypothetical protein
MLPCPSQLVHECGHSPILRTPDNLVLLMSGRRFVPATPADSDATPVSIRRQYDHFGTAHLVTIRR